jgi:hypothetical protein
MAISEPIKLVPKANCFELVKQSQQFLFFHTPSLFLLHGLRQ